MQILTPAPQMSTIYLPRTPTKHAMKIIWRAEIKKVKFMTKYCDACDLMCHIHDATRDAFKGTKHEETYQFYHDALIIMTNKECLEWVEQEGILWICPVLGCNNKIAVVDEDGVEIKNKRYKGRHVGDCP